MRVVVQAALGSAAFALLLLTAPMFVAAAQVNVSISNMTFVPATISVSSGDTVIWTNNDSVAHTVTANDSSFDSGTIQPGGTYAHTFDMAGSLAYHCMIHPAMTGSVATIIASPAAGGVSAAPQPSADDLRAQAQALLARIQVLQQQLGLAPSGSGSSGVNSSACPLIGRSLKRGSSGDDVTRLQRFLARDGGVYPEGQVTGYYGALTEAAVKRWQVKYNIVSSGTAATTGYGVVGPRTAAAISLQCSTMGGGSSGSSGGANAPAVGGFIQVSPISGTGPLSVKVQATVNTVNSCTGSVYTLDYGDGTVPSQIAVPAGNCQQLAQTFGHLYVYGGMYLLTLSAGSHRTSATVVVYGPGAPAPGQTGAGSALQDTLTASPSSGAAPLSVSFSGTINGVASCAAGSYMLVFGDGQNTSIQYPDGCKQFSFSVTHQYTLGGTQTAQLFRGSQTSGSPAASTAVTISGGASSVYGIVAVTPGASGNSYSASVDFAVPPCNSYQIDWGDGTPITTQQMSCSATGPITAAHTYATTGSFTIALGDGSGHRQSTAAIVIQ